MTWRASERLYSVLRWSILIGLGICLAATLWGLGPAMDHAAGVVR